jgi:hypothetical protein
MHDEHPNAGGSMPAGFDVPIRIQREVEARFCACGALSTRMSFTGDPVCRGCDERRTVAACFLAAIVRGRTPDELVAFGALPPAPVDGAWDDLDRREMLDALDLLLAVAA